MGLLTLSGSLVTKSAVGKAVRTWAAQRAFGGARTVDLLRRWAPLVAVAKFGSPTTRSALTWVLLVMGRKDFGREQEGGGEKVSMVIMLIGLLG